VRRRRAAARPPAPASPAGSVRPSAPGLRDAFLEAARGDDVAAQARRLLAWARAERPGLQNLGELSAALASQAQREAIAWLQRRQYAGAPATAERVDLRAAFAHGFAWKDGRADGGGSPLPPLYPFDLGPR
jgi:hypothetical protein